MNDYTKWHQSQPDIGLDEAIERIEGRMKAMLIMDMPECCHDCRLLCTINPEHTWYCRGTPEPDGSGVFRDLAEVNTPKPDWCPLIPARGYIDERGNLISWEDEE